jgi:hypothetical protein
LTTDALPVPDEIVYEIKLLSEIAKVNGSSISLKEAASLTTDLSEGQLRAAWSITPELSTIYELKDGIIVRMEPRDSQHQETSRKSEVEKKRARADSYANYAREFASFCKGEMTSLIGISGSTSYKTVSESDDLDLFCITRPDFLWIFLAKSMLLSRFFHLRKIDPPRICLSYAVDQGFAEREFRDPKDALFARDALTTMVISGEAYYKTLLRNSSWISSYFPQRYKERVGSPGFEVKKLRAESTSPPFQKFLNLLMFFCLSNYIRVKSAMLNRKLRRQDKLTSLFTLKVGPDHCIFESVRYLQLRSMYHRFNKFSKARASILKSST